MWPETRTSIIPSRNDAITLLGSAFEVSLPHITRLTHCGARIKRLRNKMKISSMSIAERKEARRALKCTFDRQQALTIVVKHGDALNTLFYCAIRNRKT